MADMKEDDLSIAYLVTRIDAQESYRQSHHDYLSTTMITTYRRIYFLFYSVPRHVCKLEMQYSVYIPVPGIMWKEWYYCASFSLICTLLVYFKGFNP